MDIDQNIIPSTCPVCHQPTKPEYYFCPNCGTKIKQAPLETSSLAQLKIYAHSFILPWIVFITIGKWRGFTYFKSRDAKEKQIGIIAWAIFILSTIIMIWSVYVFTEQMIQSSVNSINTDLSSF